MSFARRIIFILIFPFAAVFFLLINQKKLYTGLKYLLKDCL